MNSGLPLASILAAAALAAAPASALATSFSIGDASVTEGNSGDVAINFTVTQADSDGRAHTVDFATADGTATAPSDYKADSGQLSFGASDTQATISLLVHGDTDVEPDETFKVSLSNPSGGATLADSSGTGTIRNDDVAGAAGLSIADATVKEGTAPGNASVASAVFTVTLSPANAAPVTVDFATADATATAPADYAATQGKLTFAAGETAKQVAVPIAGDATDEPKETFALNLTNPTGGVALADGAAIGTIDDDDGVVQPEPDLLPPFVEIARPKLTGRGLSVRLHCPRGESSCEGTLRARLRGNRGVLAMAHFRIAGGMSEAVVLKLGSKEMRLLEGSKLPFVNLVVVAKDAAGNQGITRRSARPRRG